METMYTFDVTPDSEVIFTKDEEIENVPQEALTEQIAKSFNLDYVDAAVYGAYLKSKAIGEYNNAFKDN